MSLALICYVVAGVLGLIEVIRSRATDLVAWGVLLIAVGLVFGGAIR